MEVTGGHVLKTVVAISIEVTVGDRNEVWKRVTPLSGSISVSSRGNSKGKSSEAGTGLAFLMKRKKNRGNRVKTAGKRGIKYEYEKRAGDQIMWVASLLHIVM